MGMTPQHFTPSQHLVPFCDHLHKYAICLLVVCREGLWETVRTVVVHFDVHGELCCGLLQCSCYTEHGRYGLSWLYAETVQCMSNNTVWYMLEFKLCCEILLLLNIHVADMGRLLCVRLWSEMTHGQLFHSHKTKNHKLKCFCEIISPYITLFYLWGLGLINPPLTSWTTIRFTEKLSVDCHHKGHIVLSRKMPSQQQFDSAWVAVI